MHIFSKDEIIGFSNKTLSDIVLRQSVDIVLLQSTLARMEKQLNYLYKELDGKLQVPLLPSENLSVLQKMIFGRSSEKKSDTDVPSIFDDPDSNASSKEDSEANNSNKRKGSSKPKRKKSEDKVALHYLRSIVPTRRQSYLNT